MQSTVVLQGGAKVLVLPAAGVVDLGGDLLSDLARADVAVGVAESVDGFDDRVDVAVLLVGVGLDGVEPVVTARVAERGHLEHARHVVLVREHDLFRGQFDDPNTDVGAQSDHVNDRMQHTSSVNRRGPDLAERLDSVKQYVSGPAGCDRDENGAHGSLLGGGFSRCIFIITY